MKLKSLFLLLLAAVALISCQQPGYKITGTVVSPELNGKYVYLKPFGIFPRENPPQVIDSSLVTDGQFTMQGVQDSAILASLSFEARTSHLRAPLILENGAISVTIDTLAARGGTPENDEFNMILTSLDSITKEVFQLWTDSKTLTTDAEKEEVQQQMQALNDSRKSTLQAFIQSHPDQLASAYLLMDSYFSLDADEQLEIFANAGPAFNSVPGILSYIKPRAETLAKVGIGKKYLDFEMKGKDGKFHKLSDYVGKNNYTLIDFWASWCGPCIAEIPNVKKAYDLYHKKGFEIVGVSLDNDSTAWVNSIAEHKLGWPQLSELKGFENTAGSLYGVDAIPHTVLIDKEGTIVENNLRGEALTKKLGELL